MVSAGYVDVTSEENHICVLMTPCPLGPDGFVIHIDFEIDPGLKPSASNLFEPSRGQLRLPTVIHCGTQPCHRHPRWIMDEG